MHQRSAIFPNTVLHACAAALSGIKLLLYDDCKYCIQCDSEEYEYEDEEDDEDAAGYEWEYETESEDEVVDKEVARRASLGVFELWLGQGWGTHRSKEVDGNPVG